MTIIEIIEKLDQLIGLLVDILSLIITGHETEVICIITILLINVILLYYYITKCQKIKLYFTKTPLNNFITQNSTALNEKYKPTPYLWNGHLQSLYFATEATMRMKKNQCAIKWNRHLVHLRDGGCISLDWAIENKNLKEEIIEEEDEGIVDYQPILALIPGITGENMDKYLEDTIIEANQYGFKCVVVNHRGMSSTTLTTQKLYHAASTADTHAGFIHIKNKYPTSPIYAAGYSLGANLIALYAAERGSSCVLSGIVGVCNPFDFFQCDRTINYVYRRLFAANVCTQLDSLKHYLRGIEKKIGMTIEEALTKVKVNRDFDDIFTSKIYGYGTAYNYYRKTSCSLMLGEITIPTFLLSNLDDPLVHKSVIPYDECKANPNIILGTHPCGGHLANLSGWKPHSWLGKPIISFLRGVDMWKNYQAGEQNRNMIPQFQTANMKRIYGFSRRNTL